MTNAAAVIGLTVNSTDLQTDPIGYFFEVTQGGPYDIVEVRGSDVRVPSLEGQIPRSRVGDSREIRLEGHAMGTGADEQAQRIDYETRALALAALFDPRDLVTITLILPSGATATIEARTESMLRKDRTPAYAEYNVQLESADPEWVVTPAGS
jgi:hypothetical protein